MFNSLYELKILDYNLNIIKEVNLITNFPNLIRYENNSSSKDNMQICKINDDSLYLKINNIIYKTNTEINNLDSITKSKWGFSSPHLSS